MFPLGRTHPRYLHPCLTTRARLLSLIQSCRSPNPSEKCKQDPPHHRVSSIISERIHSPSYQRQSLYSLTSAVVEEAISTQTAAIISYHPPIFKPLSSFTLTNPLQKSLLLCAAQGISIFSPHTALDSVKGGINDWLSDIVRTVSPGSAEYIGDSKEDDLGGEGRLVRFQHPVELDSLVNVIKKGLALSAGMWPVSGSTSVFTRFFRVLKVQLGRSAYPRSEKVTSVAICAGSGGSMLLGVDADVYFTGEMSHVRLLPC